MEYITLDGNVEMPMLGIGTFKTAGDDCAEMVRTAIDAGYRLIDTAEAYGNETQVEQGIRESGIDRKELFLVTKVAFRSFEHARSSVMQSLEHLQTDYLDLVLLHWPFGNYYAAWRELEKLQEEGVIRSIGVSNFDPDRLVDLIAFNAKKPAINQTETHLYCQRLKDHEWEDKYGVAHMAYAPLGQGRAKEMFEEPAVQAAAERHGKTPAQILLRYTIQNGAVVIPKSTHEKRMRENIDVFDFSLTEAEMQALRSLDQAAPMGGTAEKPEKVEIALTW